MNLISWFTLLLVATSTPVEAPKPPLDSTEAIRQEIVTVFGKDAEIMLKVAECESSGRQFNKDGTVITGVENNLDKGLFQINLFYHEETATKMGLDVHKPHDNILFAKYLFNKNGLSDWKASKPCWSKNALNE